MLYCTKFVRKKKQLRRKIRQKRKNTKAEKESAVKVRLGACENKKRNEKEGAPPKKMRKNIGDAVSELPTRKVKTRRACEERENRIEEAGGGKSCSLGRTAA